MNFNDYQTEARKTAIFPKDRALEYTALGLVSEVSELAEIFLEQMSFSAKQDALLKELGDCYWYAAAIADALEDAHGSGIRLQYVFDLVTVENSMFNATEFHQIVAASGKIAGIVKKTIRDNEGKMPPEKFNALLLELSKVLKGLTNMAVNLNTHPNTILKANLAKLADRQERGVLTGSGDNR